MHILKSKVILKASIEEVWDFFSSPANLKKITPPAMGFNIITGGDGKMYPGQIISYKVKPFAGIPLTWVTEITHVEPLKFFVDEQRFGPYSMWHHEHHFREVEQGVEMTDIVTYVLPFGFLGRIAHKLFVKNKVQQIFEYRSKVMNQFFETV
ncbi:MAG: SRPBCC family protein [Bacteroidales bacterium]|nr:SRPBCC family protein [Bacteroidales bacterium]